MVRKRGSLYLNQYHFMRFLAVIFLFGALAAAETMPAVDNFESQEAPLTYNEVVQRVTEILENHESSFFSETIQGDRDYATFLLKEALASENGSRSHSPQYYARIVELFFQKDSDYLTLLWWKTEDSTTRLLIMSLYLCQFGDFDPERKLAGFYIPPFSHYSKRYEPTEAERRLQETRLLQDNVLALRRSLQPILKRSKLKRNKHSN